MIAWTVETLAMTTLLMALVMLVRRPVARVFGAEAAYALWLLPAVRMVLPVLPGWDPWLIPGDGRPVMRPDAGAMGLLSPDTAAALPPVAGDAPDWGLLLLAIWAGGALLFGAMQVIRYRRFMARALVDARPLASIEGIEVLMSPAVEAPMAAGLWQRRVLLPADFMGRYTAEERRLALLHEGAHHDRRDLWANGWGLAMLSLHWWNPVAHAAWRAFRADQELACDAMVLQGADGSARAAYGAAVLKSATSATPAAACALNHKGQLKDRLRMMRDRQRGPLLRALGMALVAGGIGLGLAASASGAQPAPPAPPAPPATPGDTPRPAPPAAPEAPEAPHMVEKVMMVKRQGADGKPQVEKIIIRKGGPRDGEAIDSAALEKDIEQAMAEAEKAGGETRVITSTDGRERRIIIRKLRGAEGALVDVEAVKAEAEAAVAEAAAQIEATRAEIAAENGLAADIKARVLAALDKARANMGAETKPR